VLRGRYLQELMAHAESRDMPPIFLGLKYTSYLPSLCHRLLETIQAAFVYQQAEESRNEYSIIIKREM
jgi:hypothetical protein